MKRTPILRVVKYGLIILASVSAYYLFRLIPGSSPLKYVASVITVVAVVHGVWTEYQKAKGNGETYTVPADKWFLGVGLLVAFGAAINDDVNKHDSDQSSQKKSHTIAKAQTDLALINNKLALTTNAYTHKAAADAAKTREDAAKTRADATRIKQDDKVIVLSQRVLTALGYQNNRMARQNTLEQERTNQQQTRDAQMSRSVIREQSIRTRDQNQRLAIHNDVAEASRSVHSLRETLNGMERTLNPIQDVRLTYLCPVQLDDPDPQIQAYRASLDKAFARYEAANAADKASSPEFAARGGTYVNLKGAKMSTERLIITRGSDLYPTDVTKLPGSLFNYPVKVGFWKKPIMNFPRSGPRPIQISQPDVELEITSSDQPQLWYYLPSKTLILAYYNMPVAIGKNSGNITSLPDLSGALVQVRRLNFDFSKEAFAQPDITTAIYDPHIWRFALTISNHSYLFDTSDFQYALDINLTLVCSFTFDSKKSSRNHEPLISEW